MNILAKIFRRAKIKEIEDLILNLNNMPCEAGHNHFDIPKYFMSLGQQLRDNVLCGCPKSCSMVITMNGKICGTFELSFFPDGSPIKFSIAIKGGYEHQVLDYAKRHLFGGAYMKCTHSIQKPDMMVKSFLVRPKEVI